MKQNKSTKAQVAEQTSLQTIGLGLDAFITSSKVRLPLLVVLHAVCFSAIYAAAFISRYEFAYYEVNWSLFQLTIVPVVATKLVTFYVMSHFHGWWRYVTFADLGSLLRASFMAMVVIAFLDYVFSPFDGQIPRLVILLDTLLTILVIGGLRCTWRFVDEQISPVIQKRDIERVLLVGTDPDIGQLASQINSNQKMNCRVRGLLSLNDDHRRKARMGGVPVIGPISEVVSLAIKRGCRQILVPAGSLCGKGLREMVLNCNNAGITVRVLPRFEDALHATDEIPLRPLNINDLLKRDPVVLDTDRLEKLIEGKRLLVTGAGGSIGSEICRQVIEFRPAELTLLGRGENRIHAINIELREKAAELGVQLNIAIGDVTDEPRMRNLYEQHQPDIIFHAAAHKHVPLMELSPGEAVKNNVLGTKTIASLADEFGVGHFVMVSTDKAVNPTSIMGCTKQLAERVVYDFSQSSHTKFAVVRFGNVLASAGSVIPYFQEQIRKGGPITITDERMTRYFMSIPEAAQLVMQSAAMCSGGEIYVLDMGEPVSVVQLAQDLVSLSGLPTGSIEFEIVGTRPGEKLYEELYFDDEHTIKTQHNKVRAAYPRDYQGEPILGAVQRLFAVVDDDPEIIRQEIAALVPSYQNADVRNQTAATAASSG